MPDDLLLFATLLFILYYISRKLTSELSLVIAKVVRIKKLAFFLFAVLFLPGTFVHELAHYITALLLFVPVGNFSLRTKIEGNSIRLGSVSIAKTDPIRSFLIGFAPIFLGFTLVIIVSSYLLGNMSGGIWYLLAGAYIIFQVGNTMFLSVSDLKSAYKFIILTLILISVLSVLDQEKHIYSVFFWLDAKVSIINPYILLPIAVNLIVLTGLKLTRMVFR